MKQNVYRYLFYLQVQTSHNWLNSENKALDFNWSLCTLWMHLTNSNRTTDSSRLAFRNCVWLTKWAAVFDDNNRNS